MKRKIVKIIICFFVLMVGVLNGTEKAEAKRQRAESPMSRYLDTQIQTCNAKNLLEVVKCKYATENHLISVAEIVADYDAYRFITEKEAIKLAKAIIKNEKCTSKVIKELKYL